MTEQRPAAELLIFCHLCEARHAGDACPLTLVEKLQRFPQFHSLDGGRWYMSNDKEPICKEAASALESLSAANLRLEQRVEELEMELRTIRYDGTLDALKTAVVALRHLHSDCPLPASHDSMAETAHVLSEVSAFIAKVRA